VTKKKKQRKVNLKRLREIARKRRASLENAEQREEKEGEQLQR